MNILLDRCAFFPVDLQCYEAARLVCWIRVLRAWRSRIGARGRAHFQSPASCDRGSPVWQELWLSIMFLPTQRTATMGVGRAARYNGAEDPERAGCWVRAGERRYSAGVIGAIATLAVV